MIDHASSTARWITHDHPLTTSLPPDLQRALGRFLGTDTVPTLQAWVEAMHEAVGAPTLTIDDLCLTDDPTLHWGEVDGERYHFACFYDAVILAAIRDEPVDIRTVSPDGAAIEARAVGTEDLTVSPPSAVFSFGIADDVAPPGAAGPTHEDGYAAVCPYVRAFPSADDYEHWATDVPAATVAMPLAGGTAIAGALVD